MFGPAAAQDFVLWQKPESQALFAGENGHLAVVEMERRKIGERLDG